MGLISTTVGVVDIGDLRNSVGDGDRLRRHLVAIAARHLHSRPGGRARCKRGAISEVTQAVRRALFATPNARGVNVKWIERDPLADWIYRRARGLPRRAPWPRGAGGSALDRDEVEAAVAAQRAEIAEIDRRLAEFSAETAADLELVYATMMRPMPLERRIALCAPPISFATPVRPPRDVAAADRAALAVMHSVGRRMLADRRTRFEAAMVRRGVALVAIFRERHGVR